MEQLIKWSKVRRREESFSTSSVVEIRRPSIAPNAFFNDHTSRSSKNVDEIDLSGVASKAKRMAARRKRLMSPKKLSNVKDDEYKRCKKMADKDLAVLIRQSSYIGIQEDIHGQHLIHSCIITERPMSVIAICTTAYSKDEINAKDGRGRTPLHIAVCSQQEYMVTLLLYFEASVDIHDNSRMTPLHHAATIGNVKIFKALLERTCAIDMIGDGGYTALHFACASNQPEIVTILIDNGVSLMMKSNNGSYAVHTAAKCGAADALEALINGAAMSTGLQREMLHLKDREGQLPIHNAVNTGSSEAVIVCLKFGSSLLNSKENGVTPVHYAATQGNLDLLKAMHDFDPQVFRESLHLQDFSYRTPIHWAAIFNHDSVVSYLITMSDVNTYDRNSHSPLLSAANNACWDSLNVLLSHKETNTEVSDLNQRNALHLAVMQGISMQDTIGFWKNVRNIDKRCNEADVTGSTPLHYAAWNGEAQDVKALINLGANTNVKNKHRQNPFHVACKNGCFDVCLLLLNEKNGSRLKNEQDESGQSPLHMAASRGYVNIVNVLLQRGAVISKDKYVNTPLHLAAHGGHIPCVHALLSVHLDLLDMENSEGNTPLHLSAANGHAATVDLLLTAGAEITYNAIGKCFYDDALKKGYRDVIDAIIRHERWNEILSVFSQVHGQLFLGLINYLPVCCIMVLDRCIDETTTDTCDKHYAVTYNFRYLQLGDEYANFAKVYRLPHSPLLPIEMMLSTERDDCLRHKLVACYLRHKWTSYGRMLSSLDICIYLVFVVSLSSFIWNHAPLQHFHTLVNKTVEVPILQKGKHPNTGLEIYIQGDAISKNTTEYAQFELFKDKWFPPEAKTYPQNLWWELELVIICLYCCLHLCKECVIFFTTGWKYFRVVSVYVELFTYASSLLFALPYALGYSTHLQWEAAAVAIFLAWFNILLLCQRFEATGLYIVMYLEIMKTLAQVSFIFVILMVAFGLTFYILLSEEEEGTHDSPALSMYRSLILVFELDYVLTFLRPYKDQAGATMHYALMTFFFLALYLLCMPLLLVNLMIGLAVGDIQSVLRCAHEQKLKTQVAFHCKVEKKFSFLSKWTPETITLSRNEDDSSMKTWLLTLVGMKMTIHEAEDKFDVMRHRERNSYVMLSLNEVRRELTHVRHCLNKVMDKLNIETDDFIKRDASEGEGVLQHWFLKSKQSSRSVNLGSHSAITE